MVERETFGWLWVAMLFIGISFSGCSEPSGEDDIGVAFHIGAYAYAHDGVHERVDSIANGDTFVVFIDVYYVSHTASLQLADMSDVGTSLVGGSIRISCRSDIIVGSDTIAAGSDIFGSPYREVVCHPDFLQSAGGVWMRREAQYPRGELVFDFVGMDTRDNWHSDACSLLVR